LASQQDILSVTEIYDKIEVDLMVNISKQFPYEDEVEDPSEWRLGKLLLLGAVANQNMKIAGRYKTKSEVEVNSVFHNTCMKPLYDKEKEYIKGVRKGVLPKQAPPISKSFGVNRAYQGGINKTNAYLNITRTTALESANAQYLRIVNQAYFEMENGIASYKAATTRAVNQLSEIGITSQRYRRADGTVTRMRTNEAVRRQLLSTSGRTAGEMQRERCREYGNNHVEVDSHFGSRPDHAEWQGAIYTIEGSTEGYPNLADTTGLGTVTGLHGANCQHDYIGFIIGISQQTFFPYDMAENKAHYENIQTSNRIARSIRNDKYKVINARATGNAKQVAKTQKAIKRKHAELRNFKKGAGLDQPSRTSVIGY